jgi:hypothetical protein
MKHDVIDRRCVWRVMLNVIPEEAERCEWYAADLAKRTIYQAWGAVKLARSGS